MESLGTFSGAVLVTRGGAPLLQAACGVADAEAGTSCGTDTRFQIASVSKQFTAAAVMLLAEEGEIALHGPVGDRLKDCPARWRELTVHQLLTHSAGLGHWWELPGFDITEPGETATFLERFSEVPLLGAPGSRWRYSSPGYLLAARIVERASGQPYAEFLTERLLRPLGMTSTSVGVPPAAGAVAKGYRGGRRVDVAAFAAMPGAGDIWSTVGDLARYTAAFESGELLTEGARALMTSPHASLPDDQPASATGTPAVAHSYGYGCLLGTLAGHPASFHPGDNPGYQSFLGRIPGLGTTVAILCNDEETDVDALLRQLLRL